MATKNVSLPITTGGLGTPASVAHLAAKKTIVVDGVVKSVSIEASVDGVNFCPVGALGGKKEDIAVEVVCQEMRVNASNGADAAEVQVIAEQALNKFGTVPVPPANGNGSSLDIRTFGALSTVQITGITAGGVTFQISPDDSIWTPAYKTFTKPGCLTNEIAAQYIRAVGRGAAGRWWSS
jgi:hypothetical protein